MNHAVVFQETSPENNDDKNDMPKKEKYHLPHLFLMTDAIADKISQTLAMGDEVTTFKMPMILQSEPKTQILRPSARIAFPLSMLAVLATGNVLIEHHIQNLHRKVQHLIQRTPDQPPKKPERDKKEEEADKKRAENIMRTIKKHPQWLKILEAAIKRTPITMPNGSVEYFSIESVLTTMELESRGRANDTCSTSSSIGLAGAMTNGDDNREEMLKYYLREKKVGRPIRDENGEEVKLEELTQQVAEIQTAEFKRSMQIPKYALPYLVTHQAELVKQYNLLNPDYPIHPNRLSDISRMYRIYNQGGKGAFLVEQYLMHPTEGNLAQLLPFQTKKTASGEMVFEEREKTVARARFIAEDYRNLVKAEAAKKEKGAEKILTRNP